MSDALVAPRKTLGRYEIVGEIARGAMGVVYKARDPLIDRLVAIKTVNIGVPNAESDAFERRFFREAKSAGRLNHPNVVTIHDVGKSEDVAYIAMEYLDGKSLREILDSGVVLPPNRIADIVAEIAEGLAFAHRYGVVHRDVKPANVMVLASGAVKITDFGIALLPMGTRTMTGNVFGSPRYTSPEQVMGRPIDGRSDIFSLGAVLFEMHTGSSPFGGSDLNGILKQVLTEPTPPPSSRNPKLPRALDHIVAKALAKDPAERYQDADEMASDLRRYDRLDLTTTAPAPLPALEQLTQPEDVPVQDVAEAPLVPAPAVAVPPWWKRRVVWGAAASAIVAVALVATLVPRKSSTPARSAPVVASSGAVAAAAAPATPPMPSTPPPSSRPAAAGPVRAPAEPAPPTAPVSAAPKAPEAAPKVAEAAPKVAEAVPRVPEAVPKVAEAAPAPVAPKPTGRVVFAVSPWGEIYVDGKKRGISPPVKELRLSPGNHAIEIRNGEFPPHSATIEVIADEAVRITHSF
jgi:serine/threonine-protein kinase